MICAYANFGGFHFFFSNKMYITYNKYRFDDFARCEFLFIWHCGIIYDVKHDSTCAVVLVVYSVYVLSVHRVQRINIHRVHVEFQNDEVKCRIFFFVFGLFVFVTVHTSFAVIYTIRPLYRRTIIIRPTNKSVTLN